MSKVIDLKNVCDQFQYEGTFQRAIPYGDGHINDTYKVTYIKEDDQINYILQRVNHLIFKNVEGLMSNIDKVTSYLVEELSNHDDLDGYEVLTLIPTVEDDIFYKDSEGNYWRSYVFVENATGHTFARDNNMLYEAGVAFGRFQKMLKDYPAEDLYETIEGFHNTEKRLENFKIALEANKKNRRGMCEKDIDFILKRESLCSVIVQALGSHDIPLRVTHNDTKLNNVLLDDESGKSRCVIDLDTVMPGSALYDYGDAIRSSASTAAEDEEDLSLLQLDLARFEAYTKGYLEVLGHDLTQKEVDLLPRAAMLMTLECGMRFLTDFLDGDQYFKVHKPNHNLIRARNQFKFVEEMEKHVEEMKSIVRKCMNN